MSRTRRRIEHRLRAATVLALLVTTGCGAGERPALEVAGIGYTSDELGLLSEAQRHQLGALAAFGAVIARDELDSLAAPLLERRRTEELARRATVELAAASLDLDVDAVRAAYEADPEPELVARHILISAERWESAEAREDARARAFAALEMAQSGEPFADLAAELSEEPGADRRGGLLNAAREGQWVPAFWQAAAALEEGEISDVVESQYGFHIIKLEERRGVPFDEVRDRVLREAIEAEGGPDYLTMWFDSMTATLELDTAAIQRWRRDPDAASGSTLLVRWPGGGYEAERFAAHLATRGPDSVRRLSLFPIDAYVVEVGRAARDAMLAERARELGIPEDPADEALAGWTEEKMAVAGALGFAAGQDDSEIKQAALDALGATDQDARIARAEVFAMQPLLEHRYPAIHRQPTD